MILLTKRESFHKNVLLTQSSLLSQCALSLTKSRNCIYKDTFFESLHNLALGISKLIEEAACSRLRSDAKTSSAVLTASGEKRRFRRVRVSVIRGANWFHANVKSSMYGFKQPVNVSGQIFPQNEKCLFSENGPIGMLKAADMKLIDNVSAFIGLIFDSFCGEQDDGPVSRAYSAYSDKVLVLRNKHDVGVRSEKIRTVRNAIRIFKNAPRNAFQDFRSLLVSGNTHYVLISSTQVVLLADY